MKTNLLWRSHQTQGRAIQRTTITSVRWRTQRRYMRRAKPPSRFAHALTIGLHFVTTKRATADTFGTRHDHIEFPHETRDQQERELYYYLDSFDDDWDPEIQIERIIRHRHTKYARRIPGKNTYCSSIAPVITPGVRLYVQFFSGAGECHTSFVAGHTYLSPAQPHTQNLNMVSYR